MKGLEGTFSAWSREPGGGGLAEMDPSGAAERAAARFAAILARAAEAPTGLIHLTGDGRRMRLAGAFGLLAGWVNREPIPIDSMLIGIVFDCQHPVMISDILDDPRVPTHALARELGIRSYAGFPIHGDREQIIGVCSVVDYRPREWSARELTAVDEAAQAYSEFLAAQRHSEKQRRFLDAVLQNMAHGVAACDEEGRMVFSNGPLLAMNDAFPVGVPILEWAPEHNPLTHLDGRLVASESLPLLRVLRGEEVHGAEYLLPFSDGHTHRVSIDARPILGGDGRRQGAVATVYDVTERWRVQRFREVERSVAETLVHADSPQQAAPPVLAAVCTGFDWPYAEFWLAERDTDTLTLIARHPAESPTAPEPDAVTRKAWQTGKPAWVTELTNDTEATPRARTSLAIPATSGARVLAVLSFAATAADSSTDSLIGLLSGIGAHVAEFLERRRAEDLTVELARSKDEYLGLVGHELRTPITSITAYVEMLRGADPGTIAEELPDLLDVLSRNSDALREIVDRLLDLVALDSGHAKLVREPVDLTAVVSAATEAVQPAADAAGLTMTAELRPGTTVAGDAARLRQVADQLLDNAVKHTKSEGRVIVTLTRPDPAAAELTVTDTGMGIPVEDHPRLFDRFYRSQRTRDQRIPGSGLGLPVTRAIIEWHRGKIRYVPTGESGTRVVVRLPVG